MNHALPIPRPLLHRRLRTDKSKTFQPGEFGHGDQFIVPNMADTELRKYLISLTLPNAIYQ